MDLISVIIPVYNTEKYLDKCVESFINQTFRNIEIILVDDGSIDNSPFICDEFAKKDSRIKVIHKKNGGLSDARNVGIENVSGNLITFFDSDDFVDSDYIEYLYNLKNKYKTDVSVCAYNVVDEKGRILFNVKSNEEEVLNKEYFFSKMLNEDGITVSACFKLYNKKLFDEIKFPVGKLCEDNGTTYKVIDKCKGKIAYGNIPKAYYVMRKGSIMRSSFSLRKLDMIELTDEMCDYLDKNYINLKELTLRRRIYARFNVLRQMDYNNKATSIAMKNIIEYIISNRRFLLLNKNVPIRDKIACITLSINTKLFYISWELYRKIKYD